MSPVYNINFLTPIGELYISATLDHVIRIMFSEPAFRFENDINTIPGCLQQCQEEMMDFFSGKSFKFTFPYLQNGSAFAMLVWSYLSTVKTGEKITYQQLANRMQNPKSMRAVANANGKNLLSIVIPCHRIIGSNGTLTGYSGGLWRKKWLLDHEAKYIHGAKTLF